MPVNELVLGMLKGEGGFQKALKDILLNELEMSVNEFSRYSGISQSTMYKILEEGREPNLKTIREIVKAIKSLTEPSSEDFIAVIAAHEVLQNLDKNLVIDGKLVILKEYPVNTVEDAIIASVRAERAGALAIICAPIVVTTVEKIVSVPVAAAIPTTSITRAIEKVKKNLWG